MKHVSIIVPEGQFSVVNIAGTYQMLNWANDMFFRQSRKKLFDVEFIRTSSTTNNQRGPYQVVAEKTIDEVTKTDLIIVPAVHEDHDKAIEMNAQLIKWLKHQHQNNAEIAAYCIGVFLVAKTGLLNNKSCSTHWAEAFALKEMFPSIDVQSEKIITACEGIYTSGGAYAFTNLVIYLIEKYGGRELAILTAKAFMIDIDKINQSMFAMFMGQKNHQDEVVLAVQQLIEKNYTDSLTVHDIANNQVINRRTLERRFKLATGNTITQYIQRVRVESAKKLLEADTKNVSETMFSVGYNDPKAFREIFKRYVGVSPLAYHKKFTEATI